MMSCSACEGLALTPRCQVHEAQLLVHATVSQAKEAHRKSSLHLDKPPGPPELKATTAASATTCR